MEVFAKQFNPVDLKAPKDGAMKNLIKESLDGKIEIKLFENDMIKATFKSDRGSIDIHY